MKRIVEGNIKYLLGELDKDQLVKTLKPKEKEVKSDQEKEYIRRINYGRIMYGKKMYGQAIREFSTAVKLMPQLVEAHIDLGYALMASKKYEEAEGSFNEALKINAESDNAIAGLGLSYYHRGNTELAFAELEKAFIAPNPRLEVIIALAEMYEERGIDEKANRLNKLAVTRLMMMYEQRWK
jgi:Flp pilus assembly protein TadD